MDDVERAFREAHGQAVAASGPGTFGFDIALAEDAVQDAFVTAVDRWLRRRRSPARAMTSGLGWAS